MSNPNPPPPPEEGRFSSEKQPEANGRTPTAWLRRLLAKAAKDISDDGRSYRDHLGMVLIYRGMRRDEGGKSDLSITAKDANRAAEIVWAYDMGKPIESLEVKSQDGPRVLFYLPTKDGQPPPAEASPEQPPTGGDDGSGSAGH